MTRATRRSLAVPGFVLVAAVLLVASTRPLQAAVTCSATMTNVTFGNVNPLGGSVDVSANIHWTCTHSGALGLLRGVFGKMCLSIGTGSGGTLNPRRMLDALHVMQFDLYRDAGRSQIWGAITDSPYVPYAFDFNFPILSGAQQSGDVTVYARVPSGQSSLHVGSYANAFLGTHTQLHYRYNERLLSLGGYPPACNAGGDGGGTGTFPFTASASVLPSCTVSASDHDFGNVGGFLDANHDGSSAISLQCTNGAAWKVGLDNGQHASGSTRRMAGPGGFVTYELYRDSARTQRWGNAAPEWLTGTGTGTTQNLTVHGRVPAQAARAAGTYSDIVTVNVVY